MFNASRFKLARHRRKLTGKRLGELAGVSAVTVSKIENGYQAEDSTLSALIRALGYPRDFFYRDDVDLLETETVSFRSLKKMSAAERDASLAAGWPGTSQK